MQKNKTCCFFGHRKIKDTEELREKITIIIESLIVNKKIDTFLFGSKGEFNSLCYDLVTKIKEKYPHIKRIYVRAEYPDIPDFYEKYLLASYEETYFPKGMRNAGRAAYVERNQEMINKSGVCVIYYDESYLPPNKRNNRKALCDYQQKSGTNIAYEYAVKKQKEIINTVSVKKTNRSPL